MIRDRGNIKWVSMMLPEHVQLLKEYDTQDKRVEKPVLDEQQQEELDRKICDAMAENQPLRFSYIRNGEKREAEGLIHYMDQMRRELRIISKRDGVCILKTIEIVGIETL